MIILGVTGGLASGKSIISSHLKEKYKAYIFDADVEAKRVLHTKKVKKEILDAFPEIKLLDNNTLARVAFKSKESQKKLNNIIHPHVDKEIEKRIFEKEGSHPFFVIDAALIIESGSVNTFKNNGHDLRRRKKGRDIILPPFQIELPVLSLDIGKIHCLVISL